MQEPARVWANEAHRPGDKRVKRQINRLIHEGIAQRSMRDGRAVYGLRPDQERFSREHGWVVGRGDARSILDDGIRSGGYCSTTVNGIEMRIYDGQRFRVRRMVSQTSPGGGIYDTVMVGIIAPAVSCATPGRYFYVAVAGRLYQAAADHVEKIDPDELFAT